MYDMTPEQAEAEKTLNAQGFRFSNWISAQTENEREGCMVFTKRKGPSTHYREVSPDGTIN